jgi:sigma-B regulation protein RsbU (phosphoserine phosphatase)
VGQSALDPVVWGGATETHLAAPVVLYVTSRILSLNRQLFATLGDLSGFYVTMFRAVAALLLVLELLALVTGVQLTRSMTATVDDLYAATEKVKAVDFSHRINLPAHDQLSALGAAFDSMTASVERLLRESREKSRLESEIEIAREVQTQLFPRAVPQVSGLQVYGICKPASAVGGDYYDFLKLGGSCLGLALADVAGKGISAALLMAAIRSALHAQFYDGLFPQGASDAVPTSTAEVMRRLNRHLFDSSPSEKYATFFYSVYEARTRKLTYTNAGHWPPILIRRGDVERLNVGGTAVGLFSSVTYDQAEVQLEPHDLLLAFTDGIVEPENSYGEEFGERRVLEIARSAPSSSPELLVEAILRSVTEWTGSPELQDDMTIIVAKGLP